MLDSCHYQRPGKITAVKLLYIHSESVSSNDFRGFKNQASTTEIECSNRHIIENYKTDGSSTTAWQLNQRRVAWKQRTRKHEKKVDRIRVAVVFGDQAKDAFRKNIHDDITKEKGLGSEMGCAEERFDGFKDIVK